METNNVNIQENQNVIRLISNPRKGFMRLIFGRTGLILLLIVFQISIMASVYVFFDDYFKWFSILQGIFTAGMILYLFNCSMDASAKLTWLILIMLFPVPASIFLWYHDKDIGHRSLKKCVAAMIEASRGSIEQDMDTLSRQELKESATDDLCRYLNRSGCFPVYKDTEVTYYPLGDLMFEPMLEELRKAEKFIFMEFFIIAEGEMWGRILKILADKVREGVDVRVMYDGMCEMSTLSFDYAKRLGELGIKAKAFAEIRPFLSTYYNYRDHRKILVVDGKTAFTGGVNLADEYINKIERFGHWKDTAVRLRGEAVRSFTLMFLQMWNMDEAKPSWDEVHAKTEPGRSDGYVIPFADCPLDDDKVGETVYMDILNRAKTYVHIMTPYLILDNELEAALKYAAERGIDVKLIMPGIPDKATAFSLAKSHYMGLMKSGVKIYEYTPGFVHAKVFVSDNEKAVVGTINLDYRSLYHHFECAAYLYRCSCISEIEADFQNTLASCSEVTKESLQREKTSLKIMGGLLKLIAPLM